MKIYDSVVQYHMIFGPRRRFLPFRRTFTTKCTSTTGFTLTLFSRDCSSQLIFLLLGHLIIVGDDDFEFLLLGFFRFFHLPKDLIHFCLGRLDFNFSVFVQVFWLYLRHLQVETRPYDQAAQLGLEIFLEKKIILVKSSRERSII